MEYQGSEDKDEARVRDIKEHPERALYHSFAFDYVYDQQDSQKIVYNNTAKSAIISFIEGYNATLFAYGQTGTGKTYTMDGFHYDSNNENRGIIPRAVEEVFQSIESNQNKKTKFVLKASYLQIYMEVVSDLLSSPTNSKTLQIRENKNKGMFVEGLSEWTIRSPRDVCELLKKGELYRKIAHTRLNDLSSRSHAVFILVVEQITEEGYQMAVKSDASKDIYLSDMRKKKTIKISKLNIVDLAGSERVSISGATGNRLLESRKINQSLSALGNVISALTDLKARTHIPYRDSKLTRILEDSLGGNCQTTMMAMISPSIESFSESLSTLKFAYRAKKIRNSPKINEDVDNRVLLAKYECELQKMKEEIEIKNQIIRKSSSCIALPETSSKKSQKNACENPNCEIRLEKLEQEQQENLNQIEKYKALLLKQRDIMIALTEKLNQRDDSIIHLHNEMEIVENINFESETNISRLENRVALLEDFISKNGFSVPVGEQPKPQLSEIRSAWASPMCPAVFNILIINF